MFAFFSARPSCIGQIYTLLLLTAFLTSCTSLSLPDEIKPRPMTIRDLAKSEVDRVAEFHREEVMTQMRALMEKLYRRNPQQWHRSGSKQPHAIIEMAFTSPRVPDFNSLSGARGTAAISLAFDEEFRGDRVLAFVAGMTSMLQKAYNDQSEFFVLDQLDPQKLYNSARNVEIAVWRLSNRRDKLGRLFLLSNSSARDDIQNLSFERLFGRIIGSQDTLAKIVADRTNRTIRSVIQRLVGAVFLPI